MAKPLTPTSSPRKTTSEDNEQRGFGGKSSANDDARLGSKKYQVIGSVKEKGQQVMTGNVFVRVPILIGYVRIVTALLSFYYMPFAPTNACFWYIFSSLTDAIDGLSARWLKQESRVGKLFDMLTDRCSTTCLIIVLSQFYPKWSFAFQVFVILDVCSHWLLVYDSVLHDRSSHKAVDENTPAILSLYYSSRPILFLLSGGTELFFILLYGLHFTKGPILYGTAALPLYTVLLCVCTPIVVIKVVLLIIQMINALRNIAERDVEETKQKQRKEQAKKN